MEAAGYDVVLVETVGVGQSEVAVAGMVDTFLLLTLARTGDQLQGIKKGILELADVIAVNKADGEHERDARAAARELAGALRMMAPTSPWLARRRCWRAAGRAAPGSTRCGPRSPGTARPSTSDGELARKRATSRSTGCGRWCATGCWTGCAPTRACGRRCPTWNGRSGRAR